MNAHHLLVPLLVTLAACGSVLVIDPAPPVEVAKDAGSPVDSSAPGSG